MSVGEAEIAVPYADLGRGYETDAMLDAALGVGRSGDPIADAIDRLRSLLHPTTLPVVVHAYDADALASVAGEVAAEISHPPREAAVLRDGPAFTVRESAEGRGIAGPMSRPPSAPPLTTPIRPTSASSSPPPPSARRRHRHRRGRRRCRQRDGLEARGDDPRRGRSRVARPQAGDARRGDLVRARSADAYAARIDPAAITAAVQALATTYRPKPVNAQIAVAAAAGWAASSPPGRSPAQRRGLV